MKFSINSQTHEIHECQSKRKGDWIVYTCKHCPDYRREFNWKTGEMKIEAAENALTLHQGTHVPVGLEGNFSSSN